MNTTLIVETALGIVAVEPVNRCALAWADKAAKGRASKAQRKGADAAEAQQAWSRTMRPVAPESAAGSAGTTPAGPAASNGELPVATRAAVVLAAKAMHPQWTWAEIGADAGMSGQAARGVYRRAAASQNGSAA